MIRQRVITGGILGVVGYILSPLSWWNDAFVNIPIAYICGWIVSLLYKPSFGPVFVISYWATNVLGFVLMHKGACRMTPRGCLDKPYWKSRFLSDLAMTLVYTLVIVFLVKMNILMPLQEYKVHL